MTNDFDGEPRAKGASWDIGADEFTTNAPPRIIDFRLSGNQGLISFTTVPGARYDLQRANEVAGSAWAPVVTNIPGSGGVVQATDTNAAGRARRFYPVRLRREPWRPGGASVHASLAVNVVLKAARELIGT